MTDDKPDEAAPTTVEPGKTQPLVTAERVEVVEGAQEPDPSVPLAVKLAKTAPLIAGQLPMSFEKSAPEHIDPQTTIPLKAKDESAPDVVIPVTTKPLVVATPRFPGIVDAPPEPLDGQALSAGYVVDVAKPEAAVSAGYVVEVAKAEPSKPAAAPPPTAAPGAVPIQTPRAPDHEGPSPDFALAEEAIPQQLVPNPPILPSPQEAALEAARIVSQMVDIDSESGAVIAAAAAAGAAIEAAIATQKANEADPRSSNPNLRIPPLGDLHAQAGGHDPVTTVRLSRDRILQALANEEAAPSTPSADSPRVRARTEPGVSEEEYEEFDPVAIAAAAISRLRQRARTDLAELRVHYHRHDILVLLLAFVIIVIAGRIHASMVTPQTATFEEHGLTFVHPTPWLRQDVPMIAPRLVRDPSGAAPTKDPNLFNIALVAVSSTGRLEVVVDKKPAWSNIVTGLELDRRSRWGELYKLDASSVRSIAGHDWLRTAYHYAHVPEKDERGDLPRVDQAVEFATIDRDQIYVITLFGSTREIEQIEDVVAPSLRVQSQTGLPLVPQTSRLRQRKYPTAVGRAFASTVMVVVADLVDGRLRARGGGSGVIVGADGSILTNYHVLHDKDGRLHDTFIIGRYAEIDRAPQLQCAGRPNRSKLLRDFDLALIKCDMDLDGRTWIPASGGIWATLLEARASDIKMGQRLWVLGYPDVGGGGLRLDTGEVEGWTGEDGSQGKDFLKTDASITHGNSGGPVIDDQGKLVGVAAAFRTRMTANGGVIETAQVGLVRPLGTASNLLAYAAAGWTPREGYTDVELTPTAVEASAEGVRIFTTVLDDANEAPIRDATVMVLKSGVNTSTIDMNRLDDQAIAWGKTNAQGEVRLKQLVPVPGNYTVMVIAPGYEPLIGENELHFDDKTPPNFDPWGKIGLRSR